MSVEAKKETRGFQSEAKQLLHLMIHSLYSNKEIFLRELISNASDAIDKLRFESLADDSLIGSDSELAIRVDVDKDARTVTITDNGLGMTRDDAIAHLGTIARSGTSEFLKHLSGDQKKDASLIGQFGVGFYSSFIVADKVVVESRRAGTEEGVRWTSAGDAEFEIENIDREVRGTSVILHLRADEDEFLDSWRLRNIVKKYADHVSVPVLMVKEALETEEETSSESDAAEYETVNEATALWTRSRTELNDEEYQEFYKHVSHDFQDPLSWSHNKVEGKLDYTSLLYIPSKAPFDMWQREGIRGLKLYVQRVFIMDDAEQFLPMYLRFVKGVVDSADLSLNVSREILQNDPAVDSMRSALTKRVLDMLEKMAKNDPDKYQTFWTEFGQVLKEGPAEDFGNREKVAKLLRFATTTFGDASQNQSLDDYISRMQEGQDKVYYIAADNYQTAIGSPHLEVFRKREIEVLVLHDRIDEWLMSHLAEYDGKEFQDVAKGNLDLSGIKDDTATDEEVSEDKQGDEENAELLKRILAVMAEDVEDVRTTDRLTDSPACLVVGENDMGMQMRRILESAGQDVPKSKRIFEINPDHPIVTRLDEEQDDQRFADLTKILFDQATLAEGSQLEDPSAYVQRLNKLLLDMST